MNLKLLLKNFGILYSEELGINLGRVQKTTTHPPPSHYPRAPEIFKWFLASLLFGARISETIAKRTYKTLEKYNLLVPKKILKAGWDFLVNPIMKEGGYVRYDGKTSNELLKISKQILEKYNGDLNKLHKESKDSRDLELKLQEFYSVGPVTSRIFLRELRGIWEKADPHPGKYVYLAAKKFKIPSGLEGLRSYWKVHSKKLERFGGHRYDFRHFEVALLRIGKDFFHKGKKLPGI